MLFLVGIVIALQIISAFVLGYVAKKRNLDHPALWFLWGLALGPFALLALPFMRGRRSK